MLGTPATVGRPCSPKLDPTPTVHTAISTKCGTTRVGTHLAINKIEWRHAKTWEATSGKERKKSEKHDADRGGFTSIAATGVLPSAVSWCDQSYAEEYPPISKSDSTMSTRPPILTSSPFLGRSPKKKGVMILSESRFPPNGMRPRNRSVL